MKKLTFLTLIALAALMAGCSNSLSDGTIRNRTAAAIGLPEHEFTFGNRVNDTTEIKYDVKTKKGQRYSCTMPYAAGMVTNPTCLDKNGVKVKPVVKKETF